MSVRHDVLTSLAIGVVGSLALAGVVGLLTLAAFPGVLWCTTADPPGSIPCPVYVVMIRLVIGGCGAAERVLPGAGHRPTTLAEVVGLFTLAAFLAGAVPSRRAARLDPMSAFRQE